jgi:hypothetical protein
MQRNGIEFPRTGRGRKKVLIILERNVNDEKGAVGGRKDGICVPRNRGLPRLTIE